VAVQKLGSDRQVEIAERLPHDPAGARQHLVTRAAELALNDLEVGDLVLLTIGGMQDMHQVDATTATAGLRGSELKRLVLFSCSDTDQHPSRVRVHHDSSFVGTSLGQSRLLH
jgi:hypothetical protein